MWNVVAMSAKRQRKLVVESWHLARPERLARGARCAVCTLCRRTPAAVSWRQSLRLEADNEQCHCHPWP